MKMNARLTTLVQILNRDFQDVLDEVLDSPDLPTTYHSTSKGAVEIEEMNPFHLINAARRCIEDSPTRTALFAEIGKRFVGDKL